MSAPPLAETEPIQNGKSFYNRYEEELSSTEEIASVIEEEREGLDYSIQNNEETLQQDDVVGIAQKSVRDPSIEEDARVTQLRNEFISHLVSKDIDFREIDQMFRRMVEDPANSRLPLGALEFLPGITQGLIPHINWLQDKNKFLTKSVEDLQKSVHWHQEKYNQLDAKNEDLRRNVVKKEELYTSMKVEKESLEKQLNEIKNGVASDSDDQGPRKKRSRKE
ncbi:hypothetical protein SBOR_10024 [Sclerotinia borealis F-4128]|uniref:Uncharacterized protein n=1 Tax=Sclerotinia borealis (strain F-4128) TaxID=1432307 RepID=W9C1I6_SCLBF|nr:hypothetical protein SBOR_10024 [Sclerotinia borealis F-4128]